MDIVQGISDIFMDRDARKTAESVEALFKSILAGEQ